MSDVDNPSSKFFGGGPVEYRPAETAPRTALQKILAAETPKLLAIPGVVSVGIGFGRGPGESLVVGVVDAGVAARLPREIGGAPVVVTVTGPVDAQR
jgi:hypothetical protein